MNQQRLEKLKKKFQENPKLSENWITAAVKAIDAGISHDDKLFEYNSEQLAVLANIPSATVGIFLKNFSDPELNASQMEVVLACLDHDIPPETIKKIVNPNIPYIISNYVAQAYIDGYDMIDLIDRGFSIEQIYEIFAGYESGINPEEVYINPDIPAADMGLIRHALTIGVNMGYDLENHKPTIM